jgi:hypothetical protein
MDRIEGIPTTPEGEITLELQGDTVIVERVLYGAPPAFGDPALPDRRTRIHVPAETLRRLLS